jgi:HAD superfamily hydrolase (TIGR01509 family)
MVKTVVVDLGGVLFSEGKSVALDKLAATYGYDRSLIGAILSSPQSISLRQGLMTDGDFWQWAQQQLPSSYDTRLIKNEWYNGYILDEEIYTLVSNLRKKCRIVAFSGNIKSRVAFLERKYHFRHLFDVEVYSFDFHMTKPERAFVETMIQRSGRRAEEIVYIDDNDAYAQPARDLGVKVIIHRQGDTAGLRTALRQQGVDC